jgi:hypothetical protein
MFINMALQLQSYEDLTPLILTYHNKPLFVEFCQTPTGIIDLLANDIFFRHRFMFICVLNAEPKFQVFNSTKKQNTVLLNTSNNLSLIEKFIDSFC